MLKHFDHLTIVVRDVERAKAFFAVLGFKEAKSVCTMALIVFEQRSINPERAA